jgi:hypothetical protein
MFVFRKIAWSASANVLVGRICVLVYHPLQEGPGAYYKELGSWLSIGTGRSWTVALE